MQQIQKQVHADSVLTNTLSRACVPVAVELADTTRYPLPLISPITVVFTCRTVVIAIRGAGEVAVQRWRQLYTSPHCKENTVEIKKMCPAVSFNAVFRLMGSI